MKGKKMRNFLWRPLIWVAEILDRNLLTVPEVDENYVVCRSNGRPPDREIERTRPIIRDLITVRTGEPPGFVQG
jgi:hypothetical protein